MNLEIKSKNKNEYFIKRIKTFFNKQPIGNSRDKECK